MSEPVKDDLAPVKKKRGRPRKIKINEEEIKKDKTPVATEVVGEEEKVPWDETKSQSAPWEE